MRLGLEAMIRTLTKRGPDDDGSFSSERDALGVRMSIGISAAELQDLKSRGGV